MNRNRVLGKGLSALIHGADFRGDGPGPVPGDGLAKIPLDEIGFNPGQPRKTFNKNTLEELSDSVRQVGILQPVLLRKLKGTETALPSGGPDEPTPPPQYTVVAGERRVRAARLAGLSEVPAIICTYEETEALKVALLENIQREDLGPVEEAEAYRQLMDSYGATQEELAEMLGKKRSSVANMLRILTLEKEILDLLQDGRISRGHAKALLSMDAGEGRLALARMCHKRGLSVREAELRAQAGGRGKKSRKPSRRRKAGGNEDPGVRALIGRAEQVFGSPVGIRRDPSDGKGEISVRFYSNDDLVRVLKIMGVDTNLD